MSRSEMAKSSQAEGTYQAKQPDWFASPAV